MVALWNRADHYIFPCGFLFFLFFFIFSFFSSPNLSRRRLDVCYTSTHGVALLRIFKMQVWNVLHAARWKYRTQKVAKKSPSGHHRTTLSGYIFPTKVHVDNRKKTVKPQYLFHTFSQYGTLRPTSGWDRSGSLGHRSSFQRLSRLGFVTATN